MTTRQLPREEWFRLVGTELESLVPILPETARVLVVEDADMIVGCWAFFPVVHAEGIWIAESHRGRASVGRRLLTGMRETVSEMGASVISTAAMTPEVASLLSHIGAVELPGTHYALRVKGSPCRPQ